MGTDATRETLPLKRSQPLRKRQVSERIDQLYDERRRNYARQSDNERSEATRAITVSSLENYREYVNSVPDDIEAGEYVSNMRKVMKLTRTLANKDLFSKIIPSKGADGKKVVSGLSTIHLPLRTEIGTPRARRRRRTLIDYLLALCFAIPHIA